MTSQAPETELATATATSAPTPKQSLADRMKHYESLTETTLPASSPVLLRLDGHGFSKLTSHFARPFDERIHAAMTATAADLLTHYFPRATLAYTQSDEITLVFPAGVQAFSERVQKLASLSAGYCSARFNAHLAAALAATPEPAVGEAAYGVLGTAHFDARLFAVPDEAEALNGVLWRCRGDAVRNSIGAFARTLFSAREMHGRTGAELVEMMRVKRGVVFEEAVPRWAVEGCLVKRELYRYEGTNPKTGMLETATRTRTRVEERGVREFSEEILKLVTQRYWGGDAK
ncbi:Uu.00g005780.m01.CDS01 [Anthostomella pinea]|uniref:tRNA(His) guanylyltransferase n=1 Tax=Anthostomella pinea TaxID=933095 RepID=A0AAI8VKA6_9PEZI|nr:Uu.00g005780.m01.CDS01 [Anthostomella pinea]